MSLKQPVTQKKLTNIAVVRLKTHGCRFEIACYKNKVQDWRDGLEQDIDEVLQTTQIFTNVERGTVANVKDLQKAFGKKDSENSYNVVEVCKRILEKGELQVSEKERSANLDALNKDILTMITKRCIARDTGRPLTMQMAESALKQAVFVVKPNVPAKKQALKAMDAIIKKLPELVAKAQMRLCVTCNVADKEEVKKRILMCVTETLPENSAAKSSSSKDDGKGSEKAGGAVETQGNFSPAAREGAASPGKKNFEVDFDEEFGGGRKRNRRNRNKKDFAEEEPKPVTKSKKRSKEKGVPAAIAVESSSPEKDPLGQNVDPMTLSSITNDLTFEAENVVEAGKRVELFFVCDPYYFRALDRLATDDEAAFGTQLRVVDAQVIKSTEHNLKDYNFCEDDNDDEELIKGFSMLTPTGANSGKNLLERANNPSSDAPLPPASKSWTVLQPGDWTPNSSSSTVTNVTKVTSATNMFSSPFGTVTGGSVVPGESGKAAGNNCTTCGAYSEGNIRQHMKTEWHTHNVKRKCAGQKAFSFDEFREWQVDADFAMGMELKK